MCRRLLRLQQAGSAVEACLGPTMGDMLLATGTVLIGHARWQVKVMSCCALSIEGQGKEATLERPLDVSHPGRVLQRPKHWPVTAS